MNNDHLELLLAVVDLPTILLGFVSAASTAIGILYKDMRDDFKAMKIQAADDREKCDADKKELMVLIKDLEKRTCLVSDCKERVMPTT